MSPVAVYVADESPSAGLIDAARRAAGAGARWWAPSGAAWPGEHAPERLPGWRSVDRYDEIMRWIDLALPREAFGTRRGASLFEIARYQLLFDLAPVEHRWFVLAELARSADRVVWAQTWKRRRDRADLLRLARAAEQDLGARVELVLEPARDAMTPLRDARTALADAAHPWRERWERVRAARTADPASATFVFTEFFPNSVKASVPIGRELERRGHTVAWVAARHEIAEALSKLGCPALELDRLASRRGVARAIPTPGERARLRAALPSAAAPGSAYRLPALAEVAEAARTQAASWTERYVDAVAALSPRVVVSTTYSSVPGRAAAAAARAHGARAAYVQHGVLPDREVWSHYLHDDLLVWGDYETRWLAKRGVSGALHATGATPYDEFGQRAAQAPRRSDLSAPHVVFLASRTGGAVSSEGLSRQTFDAVARAVRGLPGARLTVKPHPADTTGVLQELVRGWPEARLVTDRTSQDLVLEADVVVIVSSTTGNEACIARRPLLVVDLGGVGDFGGYGPYGAALIAKDEASLATELRRLVDEPGLLRAGQEAFLRDRLGAGDGRAAERAADVLERAAASEAG